MRAEIDTPKTVWKSLHQGTQNIETEGNADINTPVLEYTATWAATTPDAAQNPGNRPAAAIKLPLEADAIMLMFAVADTADDAFLGVLWGWDPNGTAWDILTINPILAGSSVIEVDPANKEGLQHLPFTGGGAAAVVEGDTITGATDGATATVDRVILTSNTWVGTDAVGMLRISSITGTFKSAGENLNTPNQDNICTIGASHKDFYLADTLTVTVDNTRNGYSVEQSTANGVAFLRLDIYGLEYLFMDYDANASTGTDGTDVVAWWKWI